MAETYRKLYRPGEGEFDRLVKYLEDGILGRDLSANLEAGRDFEVGEAGCRVAVRVFERYGWSSGNRLSLSLTVIGCGEDIEVYGVGSGASGAMFLKLNTWSEANFVDRVRLLLDEYEKKYGV